MSDYKDQLQNILAQSYPNLASRHTLEFKNSGAVAGYVDERIFCTCGKFGFSLKLPSADREEILKAGGKPLQYFPKGHIKKDYAVIPETLLVDKSSMKALIKKSIKFAGSV